MGNLLGLWGKIGFVVFCVKGIENDKKKNKYVTLPAGNKLLISWTLLLNKQNCPIEVY